MQRFCALSIDAPGSPQYVYYESIRLCIATVICSKIQQYLCIFSQHSVVYTLCTSVRQNCDSVAVSKQATSHQTIEVLIRGGRTGDSPYTRTILRSILWDIPNSNDLAWQAIKGDAITARPPYSDHPQLHSIDQHLKSIRYPISSPPCDRNHGVPYAQVSNDMFCPDKSLLCMDDAIESGDACQGCSMMRSRE